MMHISILTINLQSQKAKRNKRIIQRRRRRKWWWRKRWNVKLAVRIKTRTKIVMRQMLLQQTIQKVNKTIASVKRSDFVCVTCNHLSIHKILCKKVSNKGWIMCKIVSWEDNIPTKRHFYVLAMQHYTCRHNENDLTCHISSIYNKCYQHHHWHHQQPLQYSK